MCSYPPTQNALMHYKFVLHCCENFPCIDIPGQESYWHSYKKSPSIILHIYHLIACCTVHGRRICEKWILCHLKKIDQKKACYEKKYFLISHNFLHSRNTKGSISPSTHMHFRYQSLWKHSPWSIQTSFIISRCVVLSWLFW